MLLTTRNLLVSLPAASSSGKYFWLAFIVRMRHSCGTARNSSSNWQVSTFGRSTRPQTSSSSASSWIGARPCFAAAAASWRTISARRSAKPAITAAFVGELRGVAVGVADRDRGALRLEAMALRDAVGDQAQRGDGHHVGAVQRDEAMRRAHELHVGPAVGQLVAHHLGDRQLGERLVDGLLQALGERRAGHHLVDEQALGLAVRLALEAGTASAPKPSDASFFSSAGDALPSLSKATAAGISFCSSARSAALAATPVTCTPSRRGDAKPVATAASPARPAAFSEATSVVGERLAQLLQRLRRQFLADQFDEQVADIVGASLMSGGLLLVDLGDHFVGPCLRRHREAEARAALEVALRDGARQVADAADVGGAFGDADRAARVQQVEGVAGT